MAKYIKANPKVAQYLRLENDRNRVKDGNYLLWQADMLAFGRLTQLPEILRQIGGIALLAHEARQEQDGTAVRELPVATDARFVTEAQASGRPSEEDGDTAGNESSGGSDEAESGNGTSGAPEGEEATEETDGAEPQPSGESGNTGEGTEEKEGI